MADHDWLGPTLERLAGLILMPGRHNSYNCEKVPAAAAHHALTFLMSHMGTQYPAPRIMPTEKGGLVLEWHEKEFDVALAFDATSEVPVNGVSESFYKLDQLYPVAVPVSEPKA